MPSEPLTVLLGVAGSAVATMQILLLWSRPEIARWKGATPAIQATRWHGPWALFVGMLGLALAPSASDPLGAPSGLSSPIVFGAWVGTLGALSRVDLQVRLLPDRVCLPLLLSGIAAALLGVGLSPLESFCGVLFGLLFPLAIAAHWGGRAVGRGDLFLLGGVGSWLGPLAVLWVLILGAAATLSFWLVGHAISKGPAQRLLPLGPGLCFGALCLSMWTIGASGASA